jgi:RNA polymerase sigma-70 factor (ECF subfamily)
MDEQEIQRLVLLAQSGDREAFGKLIEQFERAVFAIVLRRLRCRAEALETTQEVFIQVLRKLPQLREVERFPGWLRKIAVRMAINRAVRRPRELLGASDPDTLETVRNDAGGALESVLRSERAAQLRDGLDQLGRLDRETLMAFYFEGRSLQQMSDDFQSPIGTIKRRLHTARNRLRDQLAKLEPVG